MAVSYKGKIIYQRGVGYSNLDALVAMKPDQPFRLYECFRPVTSAAIMQLVEKKKIETSTPVFEYLEIELPDGADRNLKNITVDHLLHDTAGFDKKALFDPIRDPDKLAKLINERDSPVTSEKVINFMIEQSLAHEPGKSRSDSNFGYFLLGKVIEKASGTTYEKYIQEQLIRPLKLDSFSVAKSYVDERPRNEVTYYHRTNWYKPINYGERDFGKYVPIADAINIELFGAAGGWIGTPTDVLKFASAVRAKRSPILSTDSIKETFAVPAHALAKAKGKTVRNYYAAGWFATQDRDGRTHVIGGTTGSVMIVHYYGDGLGFAISTNRLANADNSHAANVLMNPKNGLVDTIKATTKRIRK